MEDEHSGEAVARALRSAQAAAVRQALVGCRFYRDDPDMSLEIVAAPDGELVIVLRQADGDRRLPYGALAQGYVLDGRGELGSAIATTRSERDDALDRAERVIGRYGVKPATIGREHWIALSDMFEADAADVLPPYEVRDERYRLLRRYDLARHGAAILDRWRSLLPADDIDGAAQVAIGLAWCRRHAGQPQAALTATDILATDRGRLKPSAVAVLACDPARPLRTRGRSATSGRSAAMGGSVLRHQPERSCRRGLSPEKPHRSRLSWTPLHVPRLPHVSKQRPAADRGRGI